ncbi:hypothetical protein ACUHMQ_17465 [Chitinimonas sp. PSY-7]|uniref:hypothetical protein n=1 Tax=Chitinimonas sp. PSY-7 TaxID=3459088 RepID=UPI00403FF522
MMNCKVLSKKLSVLLLIALPFTVQAAGVGTAYLVPFRLQTLLPVTADDISTMMDQPCVLSSEGAIKEIVAAAKPAESPFNRHGVRAKITEGNASLMIDSQGNLNVSGKMLAVSEDSLKEILRKRSDCAAAK